MQRHKFARAAGALLIAGAISASASEPCRIEVVDRENAWPVPLVELRTVHNIRLVTDNAGVIACDVPEVMGRETWFTVTSPGYEVPRDGLGNRGVRLTPQPGNTMRIEVDRTSIAKRLGRLTGAGLFAESQKLGDHLDWPESGVVGCDSVQNAVYGDKLFWLWGDTSLLRYPIGVFHSSSATSTIRPLQSFEPPLRVQLDYFRDEKGVPRGIAPMPGDGPTWITGYTTLPDKHGRERLVGMYTKVKPPLEGYQSGLCVWNDEKQEFESVLVHWTKSEKKPKPPEMPKGHATLWTDAEGGRWVLFGDPLPTLRCAATFEAWQDPKQWEVLTPQESLTSASDDETVKPHGGSIAWNPWRQRWVTVFMQYFGKPSAFGELWYAEADAPTGPWGPAVKILSHENYTFYNPRIHAEFTPENSPVLLFEGTYTQLFADRPPVTPRYDYNQILYRLDLDDPALAPAQ